MKLPVSLSTIIPIRHAIALMFMYCGLVFGFSFHSLAFYLSICRALSCPLIFLFRLHSPTLPLSFPFAYVCHGFSVCKGHFLRHLICVGVGIKLRHPILECQICRGIFFLFFFLLGIIRLPLPTTMRENSEFHATCWNRPNLQNFECNCCRGGISNQHTKHK